MTTPSDSYDWIHKITPQLKALDDIPLTGAAPPFPWEQLASRLAQTFEKEQISIQPKQIEWRTKEQLYEGLGETLFPLIFAIPSLKGKVCWVMPEQDMVILESLLLTKEEHPITFQDRTLSESFYHFLALEVLYQMSQLEFDKSVSPILTNQITLPHEDSLCWDISITIQKRAFSGRLIISPDLRQSWVEHFSASGLSALTQELAKKVEILIHLEAGKTQLSLQEWSQIKLGDFILLDSCSLDPHDLSGRLMLTINGKNIFRGKLKDGNVKILESPLYHEVDIPMTRQHENEDESSDFDELSEFEEDEHPEDEDLFSDTGLQEEEELFEEEDLGHEPSTPVSTSPPQKELLTQKTQPIKKVGQLSLDQIPVSLVIEIGSIQMTMQKLLELEPGNLLELDIHPENGVDLVINGKKVGKGELIRIGESLGVRVLELG